MAFTNCSTVGATRGRPRLGKHGNGPEGSRSDSQLCDFQRGEPEPPGPSLFDRASLKDALPAVSEYRVARVLFAEYPNLRPYIEALRQQKTEQNSASLSRLWGKDAETTRSVAKQLRDAGFFRGALSEGRWALPRAIRISTISGLSQGKAEEVQ